MVVAEIKRSVLKQLGISLSAFQNGASAFDFSRGAVAGAVGAFQSGGLAGDITQSIGNNGAFQASVQALERANVLRTLAEPTLTAQSGREATFLAGGCLLYTSPSPRDRG